MTTETLSSVVQELIENNRRTGKHLVAAYRTGSARAIDQIQKGVESVLNGFNGDSFELGVAARDGALAAAKKAVEFGSKGVETVSDGAEQVIDTVSGRTSEFVGTVAKQVGGFENEYVTQYFELVNRVTVPGAKVALQLSARVADGAEKLSEQLDGGTRRARRAR